MREQSFISEREANALAIITPPAYYATAGHPLLKYLFGIIVVGVFLLAGCATAPSVKSRFVVESHSILRGGTPLTIVLKVDTAQGKVWQYYSHSNAAHFASIEVKEATTEADRGISRAKKRLKRISIPEIAWTNTPIWDVIDFLRTAAMQHDPEYHGMRGQLTEYDRSFVQFARENWRTNSLIHPFDFYDNWHIWDDRARTDVPGDPFVTHDNRHRSGDVSETGALPQVTLRAREITMDEARILVAKVIGYNSRLHPDGVTILPHEYGAPHWEFFPVPIGIARHKNWFSFFKQHEVPIDSDTQAVYSMEHYTLAVYATPYNLQLCREVLDKYVEHEGHQPGRYRLVASTDGSAPLLLLLDDLTGHTWRYVAREYIGPGGTNWQEAFEFIAD